VTAITVPAIRTCERSRTDEAAAAKPRPVGEEKAMSNNYQLIAGPHYADGFDFRAPTRSLFAPVRQYLANEIQKAEIIAMLLTRRPMLKPAVFAIVLVMWVAALASLVWLYGAGRDNPTPTDLVVMTVLIVVPMIAGVQQALARALRGLLGRR
jgi:peptidoglycan/LPS O-acetylase OafA/YrhL